MKKFKGIFLLISLILFLIFPNTVFTSASQYTTYTYAQINNDNTYLYKTCSSTSLTNAYFSLPKTYFVLLISNMDENFYKAQYKDVVGYVLKDDVTPIAETPKTPYPENLTFRTYSSDGTNVLSSPFNTSTPTIVEKINVLEEVQYYGQIIGDEFISNRGYVWYYCKTNNNNYGYLYKGLCDNLTTIIPNNEIVTPITNPFAYEDNSYLYNLIDMPIWLKIILLLLVCLPSLGIMYLLFNPIKKNTKQKLSYRKNKLKTQTINKIQRIIDDDTI